MIMMMSYWLTHHYPHDYDNGESFISSLSSPDYYDELLTDSSLSSPDGYEEKDYDED